MSVFTWLICDRQQTQAHSSGLQVAGEGHDLETILLYAVPGTKRGSR